MLKRLLLAAFAFAISLFAPIASAMPACIPYFDTAGYVWSTPKIGVTLNEQGKISGAYFRYKCWSAVRGVPDQDVYYVGLLSELPRIPGRLLTIIASANPLKSLQTLPSRITMTSTPESEPALAPIVLAMKAETR